jgi:hypothetical protein
MELTRIRTQPTSVATLERRLSGICWHYRQLGDPLDSRDRHVSTVLAGIRGQHGRPPVQKEAIFADELLAMLKHVARLVQRCAMQAESEAISRRASASAPSPATRFAPASPPRSKSRKPTFSATSGTPAPK